MLGRVISNLPGNVMNPQRLLALIALVVTLVVIVLYLVSEDENFLEPINTGPPEVSQYRANTQI